MTKRTDKTAKAKAPADKTEKPVSAAPAPAPSRPSAVTEPAAAPVARSEAPASAGNPAMAVAVRAFSQGQYDPMEKLCVALLQKDPEDRMALTNLGVVRARQGRNEESMDLYQKALALNPRDAILNANLAKLMCDRRQWAKAFEHASIATTEDPKSEVGWLNLGYAANMLGQFGVAENAARQGLALNPTSDTLLNNLANALKGHGKVLEALSIYRQALGLNKQNAIAHTNLLLAMQYDESASIEEIVAAAKDFAQVFEVPVEGDRLPHANSAIASRRLKVGFISPDFNNHAVMYFAEPVLARMNRAGFEVHAFYTYAQGDYVTDRVKRLVDSFTHIHIAQAEKCARQIQAMGIDVLIDLAGHTARNALQVLAYRPAPVQLTWLGYPGTTGLKGIDWRITDAVADPPGVEAQYSEKLIRLPGPFCVYRPHIRAPLHRFHANYQVVKAPCSSNGYITFGSCNNISKISVQAAETWSRILKAVPGSRLLIEGKELDKPTPAERLLAQFARFGIGPDRIDLVVRKSENQYLTYHRIDIALDAFPLTGGTTTFDTLWMGVPLVSLEGKAFRERISSTILHHAGYDELLCKTMDEYVAKAVALASNPARVAHMRAEMRGKVLASPIMNEQGYVMQFEKALRWAWERWCDKQNNLDETNRAARTVAAQMMARVDGKGISLQAALLELQRRVAAGKAKEAVALARELMDICPENGVVRRVLLSNGQQKPSLLQVKPAAEPVAS